MWTHEHTPLLYRASCTNSAYPIDAYEFNGNADVSTLRSKGMLLEGVASPDTSDVGEALRSMIGNVIPTHDEVATMMTQPRLTMYDINQPLRLLGHDDATITHRIYKKSTNTLKDAIVRYERALDAIRRNMPPARRDPISLDEFWLRILKEYNNTMSYTSDRECLAHLMHIDNMRLTYAKTVIDNIELYAPSNITAYEDIINAAVSDYVDKKPKCDSPPPPVISKKYYTISAMMKDNGGDVYFDRDLDPSDYNLVNEHAHLKKSMSVIEFRKHLAQVLIEHVGLSEGAANVESEAIADGRRLVRDGDYAVLKQTTHEIETSEGNEYFVRHANNWVKDEDFDATVLIPNKQVACPSVECVVDNDTCVSTRDVADDDPKRIARRMVQDAKFVMFTTQDAYAQHATNAYNQARLIMRTPRPADAGGSVAVADGHVKSPYTDLRDRIIGEVTVMARSNSIISFKSLCCREAIELDGDDVAWFYCSMTNSKILPTFVYEIATAIAVNHNYEGEVERISKERGVLSDNGDAIVDKHSGFEIKRIQMVDEYAPMHDKRDTAARRDDSPWMRTSKSLVSTLCENMGIPDNYGDDIAAKVHRGIETYRLLRSPELYNEVRKNKMLAGETMLTYDIAINRHIGIASIAYLTFAVSTHIPSYQSSKHFANCKQAFDGYPVGNSGALIKYVCCIVSNLRIRDIEPWESLRNIPPEGMVAQVHKYIQNVVLKDFGTHKLIHRKKAYLQSKSIETDVHSAPEYGRLLPLSYRVKSDFVEVSDGFLGAIARQVMSCDPAVWESIGVIVGKVSALSINRHVENADYMRTIPPLFHTSFNILNSCYANLDQVKSSERLAAYVGASHVWAPLTMINVRATKSIFIANEAWKLNETIVFKYFINCLNLGNNKPIPVHLQEFASKKPDTPIANLKLAEQITILRNESYLFDAKMLETALKVSARRMSINLRAVETRAQRAYESMQAIKSPPTILIPELVSIYGSLIAPEASLNKLVHDRITSLLTQRMDAAAEMVVSQVQKASRTKTFAGKIRALYDGFKGMDPVKATMHLQLYIRQIVEVFPTMIMNGTPIVPTMRHWDLSIKHYQDIKTVILRDIEALISVSKRDNVREVIGRLYSQWSGVSAFVRAMKAADGGRSGARARTDVTILRYIFIRILEDICTSSPATGSVRDQPLYFSLIDAFVRPLIDHSVMSTHTYEYVSKYVAKINHGEQMRILQIFDELTHEERAIENMKRDYRLGQWDIDVQKKVINYDKETYDHKHDEIYSQDDIRYELRNDMFSDALGEEDEDAEGGGGYDQDQDVYDDGDD